MFDLASMIYRVPALLFAITIHEYAHAAVADSEGDPTARFMGRLTFNPMAHMDPVGALLLIMTGFGWAKPVTVNPTNFRHGRSSRIKVAFAGPAANLFLCFLACLVFTLMAKFHMLSPTVSHFLMSMVYINVWFAFFNLIPIPPLDGSQILEELLPYNRLWDYRNVVDRYGFLILIALVFTGAVNMFIKPLASLYVGTISTILNMIF